LKIINSEKGYDYFAKTYHKYYDHLDSFDWDICEKILFDYIDKEAIKDKKIIKIADIGCGDGRVLKRIAKYILKNCYSKFEILGIDISEKMLEVALKKMQKFKDQIKIELKKIDIEKLDNEKEKIDERFDIIYSFFLLVHIEDIEAFFINIKNILNKGAIFIFNNIEQKTGFKLPFFKEETYIEFYNHSDNKILNLANKYFKNVQKIKTEFSNIFICEN